jgi:hypothetical protein
VVDDTAAVSVRNPSASAVLRHGLHGLDPLAALNLIGRAALTPDRGAGSRSPDRRYTGKMTTSLTAQLTSPRRPGASCSDFTRRAAAGTTPR